MKLATALVLALAAAGCSTTSAIDSIPHWAGGKPESAPPRLSNEMEYPAVNERPRARAVPWLAPQPDRASTAPAPQPTPPHRRAEPERQSARRSPPGLPRRRGRRQARSLTPWLPGA